MSVFSDDTDTLLLIPPDFFLVTSDTEEDNTYFNKCNNFEKFIVSDLITQVNDLEGRICLIENQTLSNMPVSKNLRLLQRFGSADAINICSKHEYNMRSLHTTPVKNNILPCCNNMESTGSKLMSKNKKGIDDHLNILTSKQYVDQRKKDDLLLNEISEFFQKKKTKNHKIDSHSNSLEKEEQKEINKITDQEHSKLSTAVLNLEKVNDLLKQLEETQIEIEQKLKLRSENETYFEENFNVDYIDLSNRNLICFDRISSLNSNDEVDDMKNSQMLLKNLNEDIASEEILPYGIAENKQVDVKHASPNNPNLNEENNTESKLDFLKFANELSNFMGSDNLVKNDNKHEKFNSEEKRALKQKLQEEECRRQHCERLIQKLHARLLEEQQTVVVAVKVNQEKDEAILKFTEGWNKLLGHLKNMETQNSNLRKKIMTEREKFQNEVVVMRETVKRFEMELSKALDLAHGYKEKCEKSETERKNATTSLNDEIESLKKELLITFEKLKKEQILSEKHEKLMHSKEEILNKTKLKVCELQNQIQQSKKKIKDLEVELGNLKDKHQKLLEQFREEKNHVNALEQNKKNLLQNNEELKKKEKALKENIKLLSEQMEKIKADLKEFYQEQVEKIVQEKLKEFQQQLASAEKTLQKEIEERERQVTEMAVKQVQQIVEKHVVEINLVEEKHKQEIDLWKVKLLQAEEKIDTLERKLEYYSSQKSEIAQKLQNIMETQWQEALKIITDSSPSLQKSFLGRGRSDSDKELTRQNTFTMLSSGPGEEEQNKGCLHSNVSPSDSIITDIPFCKEDQLTHRNQFAEDFTFKYSIDDTPQKMEAVTNNSLKTYIQKLLEQPPGLPVDISGNKSLDNSLFSSTVNGHNLKWQFLLSDQSSQI